MNVVMLWCPSPAIAQDSPRRQTLTLPSPTSWAKRLKPLERLNLAQLAAQGAASRCVYTPATAQWQCEGVSVDALRLEQASFNAQGELVDAQGVSVGQALTIKRWSRGLARGVMLKTSGEQELLIHAMRVGKTGPEQLDAISWRDASARPLATASAARWDKTRWELDNLEQQLGLGWDSIKSSPVATTTPGVLPASLSVAPEDKIWEVRAQSVAGLWRGRAAIIGARAAFGQHLVGTLALANDDAQGLELMAGYSGHEPHWIFGILGQDRFGAPLHHVSAQLEAPGAQSLWRASQLERGAWLRSWTRRRAGVALSSGAHELTLSVSADQRLDKTQEDGYLVGLRFGTRQEQTDWANLQLNLTHQSSAQDELSAHRSELFARESVILGAPSRLWLSAHAHARFVYEILEAEQGWTTNTSAGAGGIITTGLNITGRPHPRLLHTIRPQLIALLQASPLTRQDSLIAPPLQASLREPYKAVALRLEHELISSAGVLISAPMMALWSDQGAGFTDALQGSAALRLASLGTQAHLELGISRVDQDERAWQLGLSAQAPSVAGLTPSYQWSAAKTQALGMMLRASPSSVLWQRELERAIIPEDDASVLGLKGSGHLWGLSWTHSAHTGQLQLAHGERGGAQTWLGVMGAYTLWWPVSGWGVELSAAYETERGLLSRIGLKLMQW